ncbi:DEAD (Asp-Glu-Ala-Asp) box polypeptide [Chondrus crispus]|uniref:RNA helicase n=1 Tax=Chondrus crispus TaxID=2769 RepID=R7QFR3_CHOCR|nr:DEAD (Asp-Glu-Ala-Asp) box polypeptide [Chondrus crispus]CDF36593.1 DEAD (Asp-Glu-Ala-Asp) box polypeptide [Chondrus crispus]|eukprot:XP_005716412.1 DEAD (Asp-Glu-Ala-Asp) box polypeptide [Chondrus crispus]
MVDDPLRALLRGCHGAAVASWKSKSAASARAELIRTPSSAALSRELDFFGTSSKRLEVTDKAQSSSPGRNNVKSVAPTSADMSAAVASPTLEAALAHMGIVSPTAVQRRAIPAMRAGNDVVAVAPTGSGKTLAYAVPLLSELLSGSRAQHRSAPHALVLAPTRELAEQIGRVFTRLSSEARVNARIKIVCSKAAAAGLKAADGLIDIVIATPMRLVATHQAGAINLGRVAHVVLDEADELFAGNFLEQVDDVLASCGSQLKDGTRVHMFSATFPPAIETLAQGLLKKQKKIVIDGGAYGGSAAVGGVAARIEQKFMFVGGRGEQGKVMAVRGLLKEGLRAPILLFVQTKDRAAELYRELVYDGVKVEAIHADRSQQARMRAVERFRTGEVWVLIATDVLARGLDFLAVESVVNYDMPSSASAYVHRIGRTGRNGRKGTAVTLFTEEDRVLLGPVLKVAKVSGADVPEWALKLKGVRKDVVRRMEKRPPTRKRIGGPNRGSIGKRHKKEKRLESRSRTEKGEADSESTSDGKKRNSATKGKQTRRKKRGASDGLNVATSLEEEEYE